MDTNNLLNNEEYNKYMKCIKTNCNEYIYEYIMLIIKLLVKLQLKLKKYINKKIEIEEIVEEAYKIIILFINSMGNKKYLKCIIDNCGKVYNDFAKKIKKEEKININNMFSKLNLISIFSKDELIVIGKIENTMNYLLKNKDDINFDILLKYTEDIQKLFKELLGMLYKKHKNFIIINIKNLNNKDIFIEKIIEMIDKIKKLSKNKLLLTKIIENPEYMKEILK